MSNIDMELYKIFYTVTTLGNISKAATALFTGQPSISKSIKKLEDTLGVSLFTRNSRGVYLTEEGRILFEHISIAMKEIDLGEKAIQRMLENECGKISVGISGIHYKYFMLPHLKAFLERFDKFNINIVDNSTSYQTIQLIQDEKVDLGIVSKPFLLEDIEFIPIAFIEEVFIGEPKYIEKINTTNVHAFFQQATLIFLEQGNISREYHEQFLKKLDVNVKPEIVASNMDFIIELVKLGIGVGIVFKEVVQKELSSKEVVVLEFVPQIPKREIGIVYKKNKTMSIAVDKFIRYYKDVYR